jgi:hypothetical protein
MTRSKSASPETWCNAIFVQVEGVPTVNIGPARVDDHQVKPSLPEIVEWMKENQYSDYKM